VTIYHNVKPRARDLILFYLADISKKQGIIVKLEEKITVLETKAAAQEATISSLCKEVRLLKESNNDRDQASRGLTLCLFGLPLTKDEQDRTITTSSVA
jgi:hypothetical protein